MIGIASHTELTEARAGAAGLHRGKRGWGNAKALGALAQAFLARDASVAVRRAFLNPSLDLVGDVARAMTHRAHQILFGASGLAVNKGVIAAVAGASGASIRHGHLLLRLCFLRVAVLDQARRTRARRPASALSRQGLGRASVRADPGPAKSWGLRCAGVCADMRPLRMRFVRVAGSDTFCLSGLFC